MSRCRRAEFSAVLVTGVFLVLLVPAHGEDTPKTAPAPSPVAAPKATPRDGTKTADKTTKDTPAAKDTGAVPPALLSTFWERTT